MLPNFRIVMHTGRDFIFSSRLGAKALGTSWPMFPRALHAVVEQAHRLADSCQLQEFTDHGLPHLCSMVDRASTWETDAGEHLPDLLTEDEAAVLLIAILIHDLGMLSHRPTDMPPGSDPTLLSATDQATWVRRTHVPRLPCLMQRLVCPAFQQFYDDNKFAVALNVAKSHSVWPWKWGEEFGFTERESGLAAVLAVSDLLDEDPDRCDTRTLLDHREGTKENRAHWIRHTLTSKRIAIVKGEIRVSMLMPPDISSIVRDAFLPVFGALRNHYRLVSLYKQALNGIGANIERMDLSPGVGLPLEEQALLKDWSRIPGFETEHAFAFQLLRSFMAEARRDDRFYDSETRRELMKAGLEDVDLEFFFTIANRAEPRTEDEETFYATRGSAQ